MCLPVQETRALPLGQEDPLEEGTANPLQYSCLENPMDRGAWQAAVHEVEKEFSNNLVSKQQQNKFIFKFYAIIPL